AGGSPAARPSRAVPARCRPSDGPSGGRARARPRRPRRPPSGPGAGLARVGTLAGLLVEQVGLDLALEFHRHRVAAAVEGLADDHADPALADAVLLDVGALLAVEADADAPLQQGGVVVRAARVEGQAVGECRAHA